MTPRPFEEIVSEAQQIRDLQDRLAFIDAACGGDRGLRERVEAAISEAELESDSAELAALDDLLGTEKPGDLVGRYRLEKRIGHGGFGIVWKAEQLEPVKRHVALKIIRIGMDTRQVVARFEQERQALARMDHPHIARVLDAGATPSGRPYFVMDLVTGVPIGKYCDGHQLTVDERLALMEQVCGAIQHAHSKGIIHRDIKPSNILVGEHEGEAHATVIDFGIAKATEDKLTDKTLMTAQDTIIGTLAYMSPEQASGTSFLDTRTDVYSLGVVTYELLAGSPPFNPQAMTFELQRMIREVDPPPPSVRIAESKEALADIAKNRRSESRSLTKHIQGDLDWIVMRALEKEPNRRYATVEALHADLRHYRVGEPVKAAPPSQSYRLKKFIRRNRIAVAASVIVVLSLVGGVVGTTYGMFEAKDQRIYAEKQRDKARIAEAEAAQRAEDLKVVAEFQADMLRAADPAIGGLRLSEFVSKKLKDELAAEAISDPERVSRSEAFIGEWRRLNSTDVARELVNRMILSPAVAAVETQFKERPLIAARLQQALSDRYVEFGMFAEAHPLAVKALELRKKHLGEDDQLTIASTASVGNVLMLWGKFDDATPFVMSAYETRRRILGEEHFDTLEALKSVGELHQSKGRGKEAVDALQKAWEAMARTVGERDRRTLIARGALASGMQAVSRFDEAEKHFVASLELSVGEKLEQQSVRLSLLNNFATFLQRVGRLGEAEARFREVLALRKAKDGDEHPDTLVAQGNLGFVLNAEGKLDEAEPILRESLEKRIRVLGEFHPITLYAWSDVGDLLEARGRMAEAETHLRKAADGRAITLGRTHELTAQSEGRLVAFLQKTGKLEGAVERLKVRIEELANSAGPDDPMTLGTAHMLGALYLGLSRWADAVTTLTPVVARLTRLVGSDNESTIDARNGLIHALRNLDRQADAEPFLRESAAAYRRVRGAQHIETLQVLNDWGVSLQHQDKAGEAEPILREVLDARRATLAAGHPGFMQSLVNYRIVLTDLNRRAEAAVLMREELAIHEKGGESARVDAMMVKWALAELLSEMGESDESLRVVNGLLVDSRKQFGATSPQEVSTSLLHATVHFHARSFEEAEVSARRVIELMRPSAAGSRPASNGPERFFATVLLGAILEARGKHAEALAVLTPIASLMSTEFERFSVAQLIYGLIAIGRARASLATVGTDLDMAEKNLLDAARLAERIADPNRRVMYLAVAAVGDFYAMRAEQSASPDAASKAKLWRARLAESRPTESRRAESR